MKIVLGQRMGEGIKNWKTLNTASEIDTSKPVVVCFHGSGVVMPSGANSICKQVYRLLGIDDTKEEERSLVNVYGGLYKADKGEDFDDKKIKKYFDAMASGIKTDCSDLSPEVLKAAKGIEEFAEEFVDGVFKPLVQDENGNLFPVEKIEKSFRNINFFSFCFGSCPMAAVNKKLRDYLITTGLSQGQIEKLESQICVLQTAPFANMANTNQTTVNFLSTSDSVISSTKIYEDAKKSLGDSVGGVFKGDNNSVTAAVDLITFVGQDADHYAELYTDLFDKDIDLNERYDLMLTASVAACLRKAVKNSLKNSNEKDLVPLKLESMTSLCENLIKHTEAELKNQLCSKLFLTPIISSEKYKNLSSKTGVKKQTYISERIFE